MTISRLASYAGVTVRAVRHYRAKGLLPEPGRDHSGYRRYDAATAVELIRVRTLADAGVPLSGVSQLLAAGDEEFAAGVKDIDCRLRAESREHQRHRQRIAKLAAGKSLTLPPGAVAYLDRMRELGFRERLIEIERDSGILIAAQIPDEVPAFMAIKHAQIEHETLRRVDLDVEDLADCAARRPAAAFARRLRSRLHRGGSRRGRGNAGRTANQRRPRRASRRGVRRVFPVRARACLNSSRSAAGPAGPTSGALTHVTNESSSTAPGGPKCCAAGETTDEHTGRRGLSRLRRRKPSKWRGTRTATAINSRGKRNSAKADERRIVTEPLSQPGRSNNVTEPSDSCLPLADRHLRHPAVGIGEAELLGQHGRSEGFAGTRGQIRVAL